MIQRTLRILFALTATTVFADETFRLADSLALAEKGDRTAQYAVARAY
jgi:hypothetical protein